MDSLQQFNHEGQIHTDSSEQLMSRGVCYLNFVKHLFGLQFLRLMKLVERMPRVCKAVIKAKGGYFEESQIYFDLFNNFLVTT